jgi:hypothetical protein
MTDQTRRRDKGLGGNGGQFAKHGRSDSDSSLGPITYGTEGWDYHRNGVGGWPFMCRLNNDRVQVAFAVPGDNEDFYEPHSVPMSVIHKAAEGDPADQTGAICVRAAASDGRTGIVVFDWPVTVSEGLMPADRPPTFVSVTDMAADDNDYATATFAVDLLDDGTIAFGRNSWRGDRVHRDVLRAVRERVPQASRPE